MQEKIKEIFELTFFIGGTILLWIGYTYFTGWGDGFVMITNFIACLALMGVIGLIRELIEGRYK